MTVHRLWLASAIALLVGSSNASAQQSRTPANFDARPTPPVFFQSVSDTETIFRGQSPEGAGVPIPPGAGVIPDAGATASAPIMQETYYPQQTPFGMQGYPPTAYGMPAFQDTTTWNAFSPPITPDPFLGQQGYGNGPYAPYSPYQAGIPPQGISTYGASGAQPYRFGWNNRIDVSWLPSSSVTAPAGGATGKMEVFGVDYELGYTSPAAPGWIMNWTNQFSYRHWGGPGGGVLLPSDVFRFGADFELETPQNGPYSISLGITPSINTDFDSAVWSKGFQLDGRGILFAQIDQYWTLGLGALYWDRVKDRVLPYAGLIYRDDYWEMQLMYPESRISLFLGNEALWSKWLYVRGEYHVEAYGVDRTFGGVAADDIVEIEDYRILIGLKMDAGMYNWYVEGGWVFDRHAAFANTATPGFDLSTAFIGQIGLRY